MTETKRFLVEVSVDPEKTEGRSDEELADDLLDLLAGSSDEEAPWLFSVDAVDPQ